MDFLKNEIASKKRVLDQVASHADSPSPSPDAPPPPKYLKRAELERLEQQQLEEERKRKEQLRREKLYGAKPTRTAKATASPSSPKRARSASAGLDAPGDASASPAAVAETATPGETFFVSNDEAVRRLRQKGQPIRLFAESDKDRRLRLRALELIEDRTDGQRNEFAKAMEGQEIGLELEKVAKRGGAVAAAAAAVTAKDKGKTKSTGSETTNATASTVSGASQDKGKGKGTGQAGEHNDGHEEGSRAGSREPKPKDEDVLVDLDLVRTNPHKVYPQIYHAFKRVLKEWEQSLADRPESVKRTTQGKMAAATHATSAEYLKPLFKSLRKRELEPDVLMNIAKIAHYMQVREYLKANDAYLQLSIGNAPWPIGVTMVGIHERSGREKIFSNNVAHVLNDETSRKYIQSLKRLLTFAQAVRPPDDVSQKMG